MTTPASPCTPSPAAPSPDIARTNLQPWQSHLLNQVLTDTAARSAYFRSDRQYDQAGVRDLEMLRLPAVVDPDAAFNRLRWGGQLVLVDARPDRLGAALARFQDRREWQSPRSAQTIRVPREAGWSQWLPGPLVKKWGQQTLHWAAVRKVLLDPPSRLTARHSYDVRLVPARGKIDPRQATDGHIVLKRVPTLAQAMSRLQQTCPAVPADRLEQIARKLIDKVFPAFLTREAAFLKLLQRDLPAELKARTPRVLSMEADDRGMVRSLSMRWLRQGGPTLTQTEFARQTLELLRRCTSASASCTWTCAWTTSWSPRRA